MILFVDELTKLNRNPKADYKKNTTKVL